jgi:hypothetical protein
MNYHFFIGIDVSKNTLDFTLLADKEKQFQLQTSNDLAGIRQFWKQLKEQAGFAFFIAKKQRCALNQQFISNVQRACKEGKTIRSMH